MAFLDHDGLVKVWSKMLEKVSTKADSSHDHNRISGTASNVTGVVSIRNGGTGASNSYNAQTNLNMVHSHDIAAPGGQDEWRSKALAQIKKMQRLVGFNAVVSDG